MNETVKTLCSRASCRSFRGEQISISELREVLAAGSHAPSGMNRHSARAVAVQDPDKIKLLSQLNASVMGGSGDPFYGAPTVIVVMADSSVPTYIEDASLAIGNMLNAAYSLGLGSCWIHRAKEEMASPEGKRLMKEWGIDPSYIGVGNVILGYPAETLPETKTPREDFALLDD